jgi:outer membrane protein assembly factor BamB/tetratricopeptide (TPR) repeat protein
MLPCLASAAEAPKPALKDPYKDIYTDYKPPFLRHVRLPSAKAMKLSTEPSFFTLNLIHQDARANALVQAGIEREEKGLYREALKVYQLVIDKFRDELYRVSDYGVFVPVSQYCQRRILGFPAKDLEFYRTVHDSRAREAFEQARRKHSLIGLSEIVDHMLATSYGSAAIDELGNAALDSGHYLAALESFNTIREFFPGAESQSSKLDLKVAFCRRMLGAKKVTVPKRSKTDDRLLPAVRARLESLVQDARPEARPFHSQLASEPHVGTHDYTLFPPSTDPLALERPTWARSIPGSGFVFTHPVVTEDSVIYRHKNVVYCQSILNGEYRWINDLGGRRTWQNFGGRQYPHETVLVQDGMAYTVMSKGGPSLVALDGTTGQLRWAYGPVAAATEEEAKMRFLAAPAGGPGTIYAGYVLDNIEGETHIDTEYGVIAFESTSGRILWRKPICRLSPGKFASGFAVRYRNRIRSFASPPTYHQGTVYYVTNAGAIAALDARSGRVKWLMRYPYYSGVHDATRQFGHRRHNPAPCHQPMFWFNQRPLLIGERLYVLPVNAREVMCIDRRTGKVLWTRTKGPTTMRGGRPHHWAGNFSHLVGALKTGELVFVYSEMAKPVELIDPKTGGLIWPKPEGKNVPWEPLNAIAYEHQPCLNTNPRIGTGQVGIGQSCSSQINGQHWELAARPTLSKDGKLYMTQRSCFRWPMPSDSNALTVYDLVERKVIQRRRYYGQRLLAWLDAMIRSWAPTMLGQLKRIPRQDDRIKSKIAALEKVVADTVPVNPHPPFSPFCRMTFRRFGVQFELRFGTGSVAMAYDRSAVEAALAKRKGPETDFAKAELAYGSGRYDRAAELLVNCLRTMSPEDLDFRASVNQQLYRVHRNLARSSIRSGDAAKELAHYLGMSRTATTLADELETLFALAEGYEREGKYDNAARCLRSAISRYGGREFPVAEVATLDEQGLTQLASGIIGRYGNLGDSQWFDLEFGRSARLLQRGLPLYFSTISPLPKPLTLRAAELGTRRLLALQTKSPEFKTAFAAAAAKALKGRPQEEQFYRLREYPGTPAAQSILNELFAAAGKRNEEQGRQRMWQLADAARVCKLTIPAKHRARVVAPPPVTTSVPIQLPQKPIEVDLSDAEGINWLVLERLGRNNHLPNLLFVGGRVRKRLDNKFILACFDLAKNTDKPKWRIENLRLRGAGQEPGFFHAFVHRDVVVVHGLYDVLAFDHQSGELRWRYRVPFDFEIRHAQLSGDLLVLSGMSETLALYVHATSKAGEIVWQEGELGDLYSDPYFVGDRYVTVRRNPYNVTVRYRATGRLMGRLELPTLSEHTGHPLLDGGPAELPLAHDGLQLAVTDGWYYVMVDLERMAVVWKRQIDNMDASRAPSMRFALRGDDFAVVKENYDQKVIYMLDSRTGAVRWATNPKQGNRPQPMYSMFLDGGRLYGIGVHPGQGYYFVCHDCKTGKPLYRADVAGYASIPTVELIPWNYNGRVIVRVQDRQDFEIGVFDLKTGKRVHRMREKAAGRFGQHGSVSTTVQNGRLIFHAKDKLNL